MFQERPIPAPRNVPALPKKKKSAVGIDFHVIFLSPSSVVYNKHEPVVVVFNQSLPSNVDFAIKFVGLRTSEETVCSAQKIGDNVLTFTAPEHYPPEETQMSVHHGNHLTKFCTYNSFYFKSYLEQIKDMLMNASDPIEFMCAALHLKQKTSIALDFELEKIFKRNLPQNFEILSGDGKRRIKETHIREPDPTLLHFAARFNLIKLAVGILKCPGGYDALNMINIDGLSPSQIAHECGHEHLATVLDDAQQHHNITVEPEDIYEAMHDPIYETYVSLVGNANEEEIYVPMNNGDDEIYEQMMGGAEESEDIYQNTADCFVNCVDQQRDQLNNDIKHPDTTSLYSVSSTSSQESTASSGSGSASRPGMPLPRSTRSYDEKGFKEKFGIISRDVRSFSERSTKIKEEDRYAPPPRRGALYFTVDQTIVLKYFTTDCNSAYTQAPSPGHIQPNYFHDKNLPPIPPCRNPNVNY